MTPLSPSFFARPTLDVAPDLLGKLLVHDDPEGGRLAGRIVETEAYLANDPAMHGWKAEFDAMGIVRPVGRAADLFAAPGRGYVYKIYFAHWLLNVVTEEEGVAGAVLVRAVEPLEGEGVMQSRRAAVLRRRNLTNGPAKLTEAFGIDGRYHGADLTRPALFFAEDAASAEPRPVETSSRIGLTRGVDLPYRFYVARHPFVSPAEPSDRRVARRTHRTG